MIIQAFTKYCIQFYAHSQLKNKKNGNKTQSI